MGAGSAAPQDPATARQRPLPEPKPLTEHGPARIIAMCNQKGGVGKTTWTINLGAALAEYGRQVLLVDLDPQGALSVGLGIPAAEHGPHRLQRRSWSARTTLADVLVKTDVPGLDLLPSNIDLSAAEVQLVSEVAREQTLLRVLRRVRDDYDYILIDCQPSLGLLTVNALTAAHGVIIPLECEFFSLRGVALLVDTIDKVKERLNPSWRSPASSPRCTTRGPCTAARCSAGWSRPSATPCSRPSSTARSAFPETTVAGEPITTWAPTSSGAAPTATWPRRSSPCEPPAVLPGAVGAVPPHRHRPGRPRSPSCPASAARRSSPALRGAAGGAPRTARRAAGMPLTLVPGGAGAVGRRAGRLPRRPPCADAGAAADACPTRGRPARGRAERTKHDEKITVYISADELLALETRPADAARPARAWPPTAAGSCARRSRCCSPTSAEHGDDSVLVRRLKGRDRGTPSARRP